MKGKPSSGEDKGIEDMPDEYGIWAIESEKVAAKDGETSEQHEKDEAKIELGASSMDFKGNDAEKSPEEMQEKFLSKGSKGKKLKHLPSFDRNKKKADSTTKYAEAEIPDNETQELTEQSPVGSERSGSRRDEASQSSESASNEPVLVHTSDSNAAVEAETGSEQKDAGVPKGKKSFLGLKRSKKPAKIRKSLKSEDEQKTKIDESENISASKENDDVSKTAGARVETKAVEIKEKNSENKEEKVQPNAAKTADLQVDETPEANEGYINEETSSPDGKKHGATAEEETGRVSSKKERKSILLRSFKKLKSPNKSQQGKKKLQENQNSVKETEDGAKEEKIEQSDKGESSKREQTTEVKESTEGNKECAFDREGTSQATKRKTSDLKNIGVTQTMERKKEDDENVNEILTDIQDNDEGAEEETVVQKQDQSGSEGISPLQAEKNVKEECVDEFTSQINEKLSQQKINEQEQAENEESENEDKSPCELFPRDETQEQTENKESEVENENPRESLMCDDTQDEEVWNEADKLCRTLFKTVKELKEKQETQQTEENSAHVGKIEENVEPNTEGVDENNESPAEKQDMEQESEDESYGSAITVVSVEQLSSYEPKIGVEDTRLKHKGVSLETERAGVSQAGDMTGLNAEEISQVTESPVGEAEHKKDKPGESSETDISESEVVEPKAEDKTEPKTEDAEEICIGNEGVALETKILQMANSKAEDNTEPKAENPKDSSETEISGYTKPRVEQQTKQQTEPKKEDAEAVKTKVDDKTKPTTEDAEEIRAIREEVPLEVVESQPEDTEPTTESAEVIREVHDGISSEHELVESNAEEKTEPKNEDSEKIQVSNEESSTEDGNKRKIETAEWKGEGDEKNIQNARSEIETKEALAVIIAEFVPQDLTQSVASECQESPDTCLDEDTVIIPYPEGHNDQDEMGPSKEIECDEKQAHVNEISSNFQRSFSLGNLIGLWRLVVSRASDATRQLLFCFVSFLIKRYPQCFKVKKGKRQKNAQKEVMLSATTQAELVESKE